MTKLLAIIALLLASCHAASANSDSVTRYVLDNGLEVVLAPDPRVPKVVTNLSYRVGALNEPAGRAGFAHLFEHLMFSGTETWPGLFTAMEAIGVESNAWTWEDKTLYYLEGVSSTLPVLLSIEADRLANLGRSVDQRELDLQRSVVKNEMRQNVIDAPVSTGWEVAWSALFPKGHPYSKSVLGTLADLDAATLDDVRGFFNTYYVPNNAILVIVGDFDVEDAKALVAETFGPIPRGAEVPRPAVQPSQPTRARIEVEDRTPTADVGLLFAGPAYPAPENGALKIVAELLGNPDYGVLRRRLISTGLATATWVDWIPGYLAGRFYIEVSAADGVDAARIEAELRAIVADFLAKPLDPVDVERARKSVLQTARLRRETLKDRAELIAELTDMLGQPRLAFEDDPRIVGATASDVEAAADAVLRIADATVITIKPGQRGDYPPLLKDSTGNGAPFTVAEKPVVVIPVLAPGEQKPFEAPKPQTAALSNGINVIHYRVPEAPLTHIAATASAGWSSAPAGKEGIFELAAAMAPRGAGHRSYEVFAKSAKDVGATIASKAGYQSTMVTLSVPPESLDAGIALLADAVRMPRFDEAEWTLLISEKLDWLARRDAELPEAAIRAGKRILFPPRDNEPDVDWSRDAVEAITREETRQAFHRLFNPAGVSFISVGAGSIEAVTASLETAFGSWAGDEIAQSGKDHPPAVFSEKRRIVLLPEPWASQTAIVVARGVPGSDEPGHAEAEAVMRLLGDDFTSRLNSVIREEKGYSYGVYGGLLGGIRFGSAMIIETTVQRDNTGAALAEFFKGFDSLKARPVEQYELDRTIAGSRRELASLAETSGGLFATISDALGEGATLNQHYEHLDAVTRLSLQAVRQQAEALAPLDHALIVLAGDADVVLPQLADLGLADVEVLDRHDVVSRDIGVTQLSEPILLGSRDGSTRRLHGCASDRQCATGKVDPTGPAGPEGR